MLLALLVSSVLARLNKPPLPVYRYFFVLAEQLIYMTFLVSFIIRKAFCISIYYVNDFLSAPFRHISSPRELCCYRAQSR